MGIIDLIKYEYFGSPIDSAVFLEDEVVVLESYGYEAFSRWRYQNDWAKEKLPRMGFDIGDIKSLMCFIEDIAKERKYRSLRLIDIFNMHNLRYPGGKLMVCKKMQLYSKLYSEQASVVDKDYTSICCVRNELEALKTQKSELDLLILEKEKELSTLLGTKTNQAKVFQKSTYKGSV